MGQASKYIEAAESQYSQLREDSIENRLFQAVKNLDVRMGVVEKKLGIEKPGRGRKRGTAGR